MSVITPNTDLYLLKVPLEINDINQLDFSNATAQFNYFNSLPKLAVDGFTYQRKDNTIRFPAVFDEIITYNYVMYRNTEYSNKWFYAFITNMEYVNDNMTMITIKSDVWQCWQFSLNYKPCQVEREHTNDDTVGKNTLPESLELGDMVTNGDVVNFKKSVPSGQPEYYVIAEVTQVENIGESQNLKYAWADGTTGVHKLNPTLNGTQRGTVPLIIGAFSGHYTGKYSTMEDLASLYDKCGLGDAIINCYVLPHSLVGTYSEIVLYTGNDPSTSGDTVDGLGVPTETLSPANMGSFTFNRPSAVDGYIPVNKKLLSWPFCYFNISNNAGTAIPYRYEDFSSYITFNVEGCFGISGNVKATPIDYKNISSSENAIDYSITGPKYPVLSWKSDSYTNWLTQNSVNMESQIRTASLATAIGGAVGGYMGLTGAGEVGRPLSKVVGQTATGIVVGAGENAGGLISTLRQQHIARTQANMVADQVRGNLGAGDYLWAKYKSPFTYMPMSIKAEYARCIDEYFNQLGYATNRVKVPNIRGRRNWNYIKTVGCYIEADIPQDDLQEIKSLFDRGFTIWHNPATFADYSQNNDII